MEDIKGNFNELDINCEESVESAGKYILKNYIISIAAFFFFIMLF